MIRCARHFGGDDRLHDRLLLVVGHRHAAGEQRLDAVFDQEIVFEADQEPRLAGIALAPGAPRSCRSTRRLSWRFVPMT